jgi:hypothetical protein
VFAAPLIWIETVGEIAEGSDRHMCSFNSAENNGSLTPGQ